MAQSVLQGVRQMLEVAETNVTLATAAAQIGNLLHLDQRQLWRRKYHDINLLTASTEQARHERYGQGERIRAVIVDVHTQPKGPQIAPE